MHRLICALIGTLAASNAGCQTIADMLLEPDSVDPGVLDQNGINGVGRQTVIDPTGSPKAA